MQLKFLFLSVVLALFAGASAFTQPAEEGRSATNQPVTSLSNRDADPTGCAIIEDAERQINAYHAGQPQASHAIRVVYFVPKDGAPLTNYEARLDRIVTDVSHFYRDELRRFGIKTEGLPLERNQGKLMIHLVQGELPSSAYSYTSGDVTKREIRAALKRTVDLDREFVLVFYALCHRESDGRYVFNAPYYGDARSSQKNGLCHVADCELLDPLRLTDTNHTITYTEHYYPRVVQTVAQFNSWYLGGVAHEFGHALGLPHDDGTETEKLAGTSLMGGGNLTYRQEVWGGGNPTNHAVRFAGPAPTYLGLASALQLASHPLFTGSDRGRWDAPHGNFASLEFSWTNNTIRITGRVTGVVPAYAVIAYVWPESDKVDDHRSRTFPCVLENGAFTLDLKGLVLGNWHHEHLKLARLHVNGATVVQEFRLNFTAPAVPDVADLNKQWLVIQETWAVQDALAAKNWDAAAARVDDLAKLAPGSDSDLLENCRLQIFLGKQDEPAALRQISQMSESHKDDPAEENNLAWLMATEKRIKHPDLGLAEKIGQRAIDGGKSDDEKADFSDTLARVKFMLGKKEEAIALEQKAGAMAGADRKETFQKTLDSYKRGILPDEN